MENSFLYHLRKREIHRNYYKQFPSKNNIDDSLIEKLHLEQELKGHTGCVNCLDWNESGTLLVSGSDDKNIILWNPFTHQSTSVINTSHTGNIFSVKFYPKSRDRLVASGAGDHHVFVYDIEYKQNLHGFACEGRVKRLVVSPDAPHQLWSASEDGIVREFDIRASHSRAKSLIDLTLSCGEEAECKCLAISPTQSHILAVGANDPYVRLFDRRMIKPVEHDSRESEACRGALMYFIPGHLPHIQSEYRKSRRYLCSTYLTFNSSGNELLVNLGGEHIYTFDIHNRRHSLYLPTQLKPCKAAKNGVNVNFCNEPHKSEPNPVQHPLIPQLSSQEVYQTFPLPQNVESLKEKANDLFCRKQFQAAITTYDEAISIEPKAPILYGNRAAAFIKRGWDGDLYAALRDCYTALQLDCSYMKASFRLVRCLYELRWLNEAKACIKNFKYNYPDYKENSACAALERDIRIAIKNPTKRKLLDDTTIEETERNLQLGGFDYSSRYCGHCNTTTDIKEANFYGNNEQYIVAGSDDGLLFVWNKKTSNLIRVLQGDKSIVNCVQSHPSISLLATSGIEPLVRLWSPSSDGSNTQIITNIESVTALNQHRMKSDPLDSVFLSMRMRHSSDGDGDVIPCSSS